MGRPLDTTHELHKFSALQNHMVLEERCVNTCKINNESKHVCHACSMPEPDPCNLYLPTHPYV